MNVLYPLLLLRSLVVCLSSLWQMLPRVTTKAYCAASLGACTVRKEYNILTGQWRLYNVCYNKLHETVDLYECNYPT